MSLTAAMSTALSGLTANVRAVSLISNNIANADTDGYARRVLDLSVANVGTTGGVQINSVVRQTDTYLTSDRRVLQAELAYTNEMQSFYETMDSVVGNAEESGSLTDLLTQFENALITAASNPAEDIRLENLAYTAEDLVEKINDISTEIQTYRETADENIESMVDIVNENLEAIAEINVQIIKVAARDGDTSSLQDQQAVLLDEITTYIPISTTLQDNDTIHVYTNGGLALLENNVSTLEFEKSNIIEAGVSYEDGNLSGLVINGNEINTTSTGTIAGGAIAAMFEIRDEIAVEEQAQIDAIAMDLIERVATTSVDPTIDPTLDPALFTDSGAVFDPTNEVGIASRLTLNSDVSPDGGEFWKLRDGLGATVEGNVGDATILNAIADSLTEEVVPTSASLDAVNSSFVSHIQDFSSEVSASLTRAQNDTTYTNTRYLASSEAELAIGVDTDQELQLLIRAEQQYAANAQVMSVIDELMQTLLNTF